MTPGSGKIKEKEFYRMCDIVEDMGDVVNEYYPTVEELEEHRVRERIDKFLPLLAYYAADPFADLEIHTEPDYQKTVKYCKKLLYTLELEEN